MSKEDVLDIRDLIERFEELLDERETLSDAFGEAEGVQALETAHRVLEDWDGDNGEELQALRALLDELSGSGGDHQWKGDWYPLTLIHDSYFVESMQELVQDIGDLPKDIPGYLVIDWDKTAENLQQDYTSVEYRGETYWYR